MHFPILLSSMLLTSLTLVIAAPNGTHISHRLYRLHFLFSHGIQVVKTNKYLSKIHSPNALSARNQNVRQSVLTERTSHFSYPSSFYPSLKARDTCLIIDHEIAGK